MSRRRDEEIELNEWHRLRLQSYAGSRNDEAAMVRRAKTILLAADGLSNTEIGRQLGITRQTVAKTLKRFAEEGFGDWPHGGPPDDSALRDLPRSGRPRHRGESPQKTQQT